MSFFSKNISTAILAIVSLLATAQASAGYIDSKTDGSLVYSLYATPNKILRYDMAAETSLTNTPLSKAPTAFTVIDGTAYVAFGRELRAINLATGADVFVQNVNSDIAQIVAQGENLLILEQSGTATLISTANYQHLDSRVISYADSAFFAASSINSTVYYMNINSPYIYRFNLGKDGKITDTTTGPYNWYTHASKIFLNKSQNKIYDNSGTIYFSDSLAIAGNLSQKFDSLNFIDDNPVTVVDKQIKVFTAFNTLKGEINLASKPIFSASYGQKLFTFSASGDELSALANDLSRFNLPPLGQAANPLEVSYTPDVYEADNEGNIYALDNKTLSIFRWSTTKNAYLETWPLTSAPISMAYSAAHKRLYLGYTSGKISYISTAETTLKEYDFAVSTSGVHRIVAAGNFLFVADKPDYGHSESTLDINGNTLSSKTAYTVSQNYQWNETNNRIYRSSTTKDHYISWVELNPITGTQEAVNNYEATTLSQALLASNGDQYLLTSSGQLLDPYSLKHTNSLSNSVSDGAWINGNLITIGKAPLSVQFWGMDYEQLFSYPLANTSSARLLKTNGKLVLVQQQANGPIFTLFNPNQLPDTDGDGIHNFKDNCSNIANSDQTNTDGDSEGNICDSDDDNDGIFDSQELTFALNPLDANDAQMDLDNDGFNNLVEISQGTSISDRNSTPKFLTHFNESFENAWPAGFYNDGDKRAWLIQSEGASGNKSLISPPFISNDSSSKLSFTAAFNDGLLSVKYKTKIITGNSYGYSISILVDDVIQTNSSIYEYENSWQTLDTHIARGVHKISIQFTNQYGDTINTSDQLAIDDIQFQSNPENNDTDGDGLGYNYDNCPLIANENQADLDLDGTGDACDATDSRLKDTDLDLVEDSIDNCPLIKNIQSEDQDRDNIGDACDADIDGDGVANNIEKTFSFMNERNAADAKKDQDGDGVSNGYEIASGTQPDVADIFPSISLFDYYPLGKINTTASYFNGYQYLDLVANMKNLPAPNTYEVITRISYAEYPGETYQSSSHIERKDSGIYLTQSSYTSSQQNPQTGVYKDIDIVTTFNNTLVLPAAIKLGEIIVNQSTSSQIESGISYKQKITTTFELLKTGQTIWKGTSYPSVTIKVDVTSVADGASSPSGYAPYQYTEVNTYIKNIGQIEGGGFTYENIDIISQDIATAPAPIVTPAPIATPAVITATPIVTPAPTLEPASGGKKSGGGAMDIGFLIGLVLLTAMMTGRKKRLS